MGAVLKKVFICTDSMPTRLNPYGLSIFNRVVNSASKSDIPIVGAPEKSDIIIFCEPRDYFQTNLLKSDFYREFKSKTVIFSQQDNCIPRIPGIYNRIPLKYHNVKIYEYGFYTKVFDFSALDRISANCSRRHLYSFIGNGRACPEVRQKILSLSKENALLIDTQLAFSDATGRYSQSIADSFFVLAPRGLGPSSFRLFEAMRAGRVPVIISDEWRPIAGINWDDFSIRVQQSDINSIPELLESKKEYAVEMGIEARRAYNNFFSINSGFVWLVNTAERLLAALDGNSHYVYRPLLTEGFRYGVLKSTLLEVIANRPARRQEVSLSAHSCSFTAHN